MKWDDVLEWVAVVAPIVPLLEWLWLRLRQQATAGWFVAGLMVSVGAEILNLTATGNNLWVTYVFAPVQIACFLAAVSRGTVRWLLIVGFLGLGVLSALRGPLTRYELVVQGLGLPVVAYLAWGRPGRVSRAIRSYCVWTILPLIGLSLWPTLGWWTGYQVVRLGAIGRFTWAMGQEAHDVMVRGATGVGRAADLGAPRAFAALGAAPARQSRGMASGHPGSQGTESTAARGRGLLPGNRGSGAGPGTAGASVAGGR